MGDSIGMLMEVGSTGAGDRLIGITDQCDRPPGVRSRRHVVSVLKLLCSFCLFLLMPYNHFRDGLLKKLVLVRR